MGPRWDQILMARLSPAIGDASGLPKLIAAMEGADYGPQVIRKICHGNWLKMIMQQIG